MIIPFGKFKGKSLEELPTDYLFWCFKNNEIPERKTKFSVPEDIAKEAKRIYDERKYPEQRLAGKPNNKIDYIIEFLGDLEGISVHSSLDNALKYLEMEFPLKVLEEDDWNGRKKGSYYRCTPDPEDDRILIWEILPSGHKKVVWHFSGWHWNSEEFLGLEQGKLPSDEKSLYALACED